MVVESWHYGFALLSQYWHWLCFPHRAKQDPARLLIKSSCRLLSSQLLPGRQPRRAQSKPATLLPHFAFACQVCSTPGNKKPGLNRSVRTIAGRWIRRRTCLPVRTSTSMVLSRPLPHPALHVFLTQGSSLTPRVVIWGGRNTEGVVKLLLMEYQGEAGSDRGQTYHREIHLCVKKCMYLPPNPAGEPVNQWSTPPPITWPCLYTAAVLCIPPPPAAQEQCPS